MGKARLREEVIILIAEDDEGHAALIRKNLARHGTGNQVKYFSDGQKVLDFLLAGDDDVGEAYDNTCLYLLLLDIRMPKLDGIEVLRRIKSEERLKEIPVIMVTTTEDPAEVEKCYSCGCSGYLTKPVNHEKLARTLESTGLI